MGPGICNKKVENFLIDKVKVDSNCMESLKIGTTRKPEAQHFEYETICRFFMQQYTIVYSK